MMKLPLLVALAACGKTDKPAPEVKSTPVAAPTPAAIAAPIVDAPEPPLTPPIEVTAGAFYKEYASDADAAEKKYLHKLVRVQGIVEDKGSTVLQLAARGGRDHVNAWFIDSGKPLAGVKRHDVVTAHCRGDVMLDVPTLRECVLEKVEPFAAPAPNR